MDHKVVSKELKDAKKRKSPNAQSNLDHFFVRSSRTDKKKQHLNDYDVVTKVATDCHPIVADKVPAVSRNDDNNDDDDKLSTYQDSTPTVATKTDDDVVTSCQSYAPPPDPIIPYKISDSQNTGTWKQYKDCCLILAAKEPVPSSTKVAAFDLDGTLLVWRTANWPSRFDHYELWSSQVPATLQSLYDNGHRLVLFTNQGGIQRAWNGKKATFIKDVIHWLANLIRRPLHAVVSTLSPNRKQYQQLSHHKPRPNMWILAETFCNNNVQFQLEESFYVGDSATPINPSTDLKPMMPGGSSGGGTGTGQDAVDLRFAQNVGELRGGKLSFYTPDEYFGPSDDERRTKAKSVMVETPPEAALRNRISLLGGYHSTIDHPILIVLCGVQGSGKSTFCQNLLHLRQDHDDDGQDQQQQNQHWIHLSQDTISNGKPGKREKVEAAALDALRNGRSVIVDRTNIDPTQRSYFVNVAKAARTPIHAIVLNPSVDVVKQRVLDRTNHPAGFQGEKGVQLTLTALGKMVIPTYKEGFDLISSTATEEGARRLCNVYRKNSVSHNLSEHDHDDAIGTTPLSFELGNGVSLPSVSFGTFKLGKRDATQLVKIAIQTGFRSVDTAPSYNNEKQVGIGLNDDTFCIVKIPLRAVQPEQVRQELQASMKELNKDVVDLVLLHWPSQVMSSGTLHSVWGELEKCLKAGMCKALGVCNFNVAALATLLAQCSSRPVVNQVERHPLLPQVDLLDYCINQDVLIQAHTPLGGDGNSQLLQHPVVQSIAKETSMTCAQVLIQWNLQQGVPVVTKSRKEMHMRDILSCKRLAPCHMKVLDTVGPVKRFVAPPFMFGKSLYAWASHATST